MNGPLDRLKALISRGAGEVRISDAAIQRYNQCIEEWNANWTEDEWCDGPRGQACADFIDWYDEVHR